MTIIELNQAFSTEERCREMLKRLRWPDGVSCIRCQSKSVASLSDHYKFECSPCGYQFTVMVGTVFHGSHLSLDKWFLATYMMCESRKGVSANQLKRVLGVSYKTAWYLCHRIRAAMKDADTTPLAGIIEVDETYVGGKRQRVGRGRGLDNKIMVLAAIQRSGPVRLRVDRRADSKTLLKFIREKTAAGEKRIMTDEWRGYASVGGGEVTHETVNHKAKEWVRGDVHTNSVEGVFSLFKRSVIGAYHHLSAKHLHRYLDEFEFRFNRRTDPHLFVKTLHRLVTALPMTFEALTAEEA